MCGQVQVEATASVGAAVAVGVSDAAAGVSGFVDVPVSDPAFAAVCWMGQQQITAGTAQADGSALFQPTGLLSRQVMAQWLYNLAGQPAHVAPSVSRFYDVYTSSQFYVAVDWLEAEGLLQVGTTVSPKTGATLLLFEPSATVSRGQFAQVLFRFAARYGDPAVAGWVAGPAFSDVSSADPAYQAVSWLAATGIASGSGGKYTPGSGTARSAFALMAHRYAHTTNLTPPNGG